MDSISDIMRNNMRDREIPKFREPELERKWKKIQPILIKLKKMEKAGKFKELE